MSGCSLMLCVLMGQIVGDDRYGTPPVNASPPAASSSRSPATGSTRRAVSPPPPFTPPSDSSSSSTTSQDYGYGTAANRPATLPLGALNGATSDASESEVKPSVMMRAVLAPPTGSRLTGQSVRLADVLLGATSRDQQSQRLDAYWDLCSSVADYYLSVREQDELQRLRSSVASVGPAWQQAESELGVRIGTSQRAAVAAQYRLANWMGRSNAASLPLPGDMPHCGDYYARYDQIFVGRQSAEAQQLSELLPMRFDELTDATAAVKRAEEFLAAVAAQRAGDGTGTLRALELLALRRRAFVQIARDYNQRIARYTELALPGTIDSERLIGMLIRREPAASTATRPETPVPPLNRQSQQTPADPAQTFADGWESLQHVSAASRDDSLNDEGVKPASAETKVSKPRREHSLLVPAE